MFRRTFSKLAASLLLTPFIGYQAEMRKDSIGSAIRHIANQIGRTTKDGILLEGMNGFKVNRSGTKWNVEYQFIRVSKPNPYPIADTFFLPKSVELVNGRVRFHDNPFPMEKAREL